jgi:hypothetical protein
VGRILRSLGKFFFAKITEIKGGKVEHLKLRTEEYLPKD